MGTEVGNVNHSLGHGLLCASVVRLGPKGSAELLALIGEEIALLHSGGGLHSSPTGMVSDQSRCSRNCRAGRRSGLCSIDHQKGEIVRFVIATRRLSAPGGSETFVLTLAEALAQLGHDVVLFALEHGLVADEAGRRALTVLSPLDQLPHTIDVTIALDRVLAIDMALRYPRATRLYAVHNALEEWLPPPEVGIVAGTLAPNTRFETLARGCVGAGEVIRIRQPINIVRYSPRSFANPVPLNVLSVGNYSNVEGQRLTQLRQAWDEFGLNWHILGYPVPTLNVPEAIAAADIVVGYGRSILEAMSCGRPAYVHEHSGSDGWVTPESYERLEADGFTGSAIRTHPSSAALRADFAFYHPDLGRAGQDFVRMHHDAKIVAANIVDRIAAIAGNPASYDLIGLYGLKRLAESHMRAEQKAERYRSEAKALAAMLQTRQEGSSEAKVSEVVMETRREGRAKKLRRKLTDCEKRVIAPNGGYENLFACMTSSQIAAAQWLSQNKPPDWTIKRISCSDAPVTADL